LFGAAFDGLFFSLDINCAGIFDLEHKLQEKAHKSTILTRLIGFG
jgi:hypothetical protein